MKKEIIQHLLLHLEKKSSLSITENELMEKLFTYNNERKEILKALISLFSEDYGSDLERAAVLDNEIAQKIYELEFVSKEKRLHFVLGKCTKEEEQDVYEKMFKALHLVLIAEEHDQISSHVLTENLPSVSANKLKKLSRKPFNLEQAVQNLEKAQNTLLDVSKFLDQQKHQSQQISQQKQKAEENEESKLLGISSSVDSFRMMMGRHAPLESSCSKESQTALAHLGSAVDQLHPVLQFVADSTKQSLEETKEKKKFDQDSMLEKTKKMANNSLVSKCFSADFVCNGEVDQ